METIHQDFKDFLRLFEEEKVEYLLVGGYAIGNYGYPRATADMDIWIATNPVNAEKCAAAIRKFGMDVPEVVPELFLKPNSIIRLGLPPIRIEVHTTLSGVEFDACFARRHRVSVGGISINIISLEDLKRNKTSAGRHRDLDDLQHLP